MMLRECVISETGINAQLLCISSTVIRIVFVSRIYNCKDGSQAFP